MKSYVHKKWSKNESCFNDNGEWVRVNAFCICSDFLFREANYFSLTCTLVMNRHVDMYIRRDYRYEQKKSCQINVEIVYFTFRSYRP